MNTLQSLRTAAAAALLLLTGACGSGADTQPGPSRWVDPLIGSGGHGHVFVGANVPHGMVQLGPQQPYRGWDWCSGYHYSDSVLLGFSHSRLSGTGIGDLGDILLMPYDPARVRRDTAGVVRATLDHARECVRPGYYRLRMPDCGVEAELTATARVGYHRYAFDGDRAALLVDLITGVGWDEVTQAALRRVDDRTITGYRRSTGWAKDQTYYFAATFSRPMAGGEPVDSCGAGVRRTLRFDLDGDRRLEVKVALSSVSEEGALRNLAAELPDWDFDGTAAAARAAWDRELGRIGIVPMDERQGRIFYTALYHTMIAPSLFSDVDGSYRGADGQVHRSEVPTYTVLSLWDTYRAAMPLTTLIDPELSAHLADTFLKIFREQGKLPVWHLAGNETDCMVGNPGVIVLADLLLKGFVPEERLQEAVKAMRTSSLRDERGLELLKQWGYIPFDRSAELETVAKGLEFAIADGALAKAAAAAGDTVTAGQFARRSRSYEHYFDPQTQFMRGRASDGSFRTPFDEFHAPHMQSDYTEGNAWQYTWLVPHDVHGLIALFGGEEPFLRKLRTLFVIEGDLGDTADDVTGLIGQYAHGNEPSHHVAYLFNYAGEQFRCAERVRQILATLYTDRPDGICGNEDVGQMSAWYVLSSLGLYQVDPAGGLFVLGSPAVREATLRVGEDRTFRIVAHDNSDENRYILRAALDGEPLTRSYLTYEEIVRGGVLELWMGAEPSDFGSAPADRP